MGVGTESGCGYKLVPWNTTSANFHSENLRSYKAKFAEALSGKLTLHLDTWAWLLLHVSPTTKAPVGQICQGYTGFHSIPSCLLFYLSSLAHSAKHLTLLVPTLLFPRPFWQYSHWTLENNELTLLLFKFSLIVPLTIWLSFSISPTQIICVTLHSSVLLCQLQTTVLPTPSHKLFYQFLLLYIFPP